VSHLQHTALPVKESVLVRTHYKRICRFKVAISAKAFLDTLKNCLNPNDSYHLQESYLRKKKRYGFSLKK